MMAVKRMNPEVKAKWIEALESGRYSQTRGYLRRLSANVDGDEVDPAQPGFCCLGVLCDLAVQEGLLEARETFEGTDRVVEYDNGGCECELCRYEDEDDELERAWEPASLPGSVVRWAGLSGSSPEVEYDGDAVSLIVLNDEKRLSFSEIAELIRDQL